MSRSSVAGARVVPPLLVLAVVSLVLAGCSGSSDRASGSAATPSPAPATPVASTPGIGNLLGLLDEIPSDARVSSGGPDPRTPGYWIMWSTCGEGSQAEVARQNGGAAAGWILVDDLLADPGLYLGDTRLASCDDAIAVLGKGDDRPAQLARATLTTELNLSSGSETCTAAEGVLRVARLLLSGMRYVPPSGDIGPIGDPTRVDETIVLLESYNSGELCR